MDGGATGPAGGHGDVGAALRAACADVRPAGEGDAVSGVAASWVVTPRSAEEAAAVMRASARHDLAVVPTGAGTKLDWGAPPNRLDVILRTSGLTGDVEHAPGDLVARVPAGMALSDLAGVLAEHGQQLVLDDPTGSATVGGALATATAGPRRLLYGTARDLLIGITVVRPDGAITRSGGKVVKNVAGYDLGKLYTGSYGTLGLIVDATFRLHPLPAARAFVTAVYAGAEEAARAAHQVAGSQAVASAVEVERTGPGAPVSVAVLLEGVPEGVAARSQAVRRILGYDSQVAADPPVWWGRLPSLDGGVLVEVTFPLSALGRVLAAIDEAAGRAGARPAVRGSGAGALCLGLLPDVEPSVPAEFVPLLRAELGPLGGHVVVRRAPDPVRPRLDLWGPVAALPLMRRVKERFDPGYRVSPGRFAGGI
ncbi:FAD-binding oxidoreductase [Bailinhaonella thermotolerans]|uniref:FAD-binding oxidoreductase n=2 Tax=Bailinhaonella thermotolerans TaxID=1070861 RepID=A0A3A4AYG2_9ACTN|nr:FAD-binding oxidoreductase [Bailinhaonella thermotolerans]